MAPRPEPTHPALRLALRLPRQGIMPRPSRPTCGSANSRTGFRKSPSQSSKTPSTLRPVSPASSVCRSSAWFGNNQQRTSQNRKQPTVFAVGENHNFCCDISHNAKLKPTEKDKGCTQLQQRHRKSTWTGTPPACGRGWSEHTAAATFTSWSSSPTRRPLGNLSILGQPRR